MQGVNWLRAGLLAMAWQAGAAQAAGEIDRRFGVDGMVRLALQPVDGQSHDIAVAACARPDGSLFVAGFASGGLRIVSAWYTERGALDLRYSGDGKASFPIGPDVPYTARGLCLPDGRVVLTAEMVNATSNEGAVHVWRLDPASGELDPGFGAGGVRVLDLDAYDNNLGTLESVRSLTLGRDGDLLLGGLYSQGSQDDRLRGFLARLDAQGSVRAVTLAHQWNPAWNELGPAAPAADGTLWSAARRSGNVAGVEAALLRFDYDTLVYRDTLHAQISVDLSPEHAVMLDGATMALAGFRQGGKPLVALLRADAVQVLQPPLPAGYQTVQNSQLAALPGGRLLYAAAAKDGAGTMRSMAFARLRIGAGDVLQADPTFGEGGVLGSAYPAAAACAGQDSAEIFRRFTYWKGRPTAVGTVNAACDAAPPDYDWMLLRLDLERVFRDGFGADD
jgi:hypothetical protein